MTTWLTPEGRDSEVMSFKDGDLLAIMRPVSCSKAKLAWGIRTHADYPGTFLKFVGMSNNAFLSKSARLPKSLSDS
jgi:hypothetical protein